LEKHAKGTRVQFHRLRDDSWPLLFPAPSSFVSPLPVSNAIVDRHHVADKPCVDFLSPIRAFHLCVAALSPFATGMDFSGGCC